MMAEDAGAHAAAIVLRTFHILPTHFLALPRREQAFILAAALNAA